MNFSKKYRLVAPILCAILSAQAVLAVTLPKAAGFVDDFAGILQASDKQALETVLTDYEKQTSNEVVVVTVSSFEGLDRFTYSQELFTSWKIGKAGKNNGILFLINPTAREAFINVGKGLEGALPDSLAGTILRNEVFPNFKAGDYAAGISKGVMAIIQATKGEYKADASSSKNVNTASDLWAGFFWFGIFFVSWLGAFLGRTKSWWLGGVIGGVISLIIGLINFTGLIILFVTIFGAGAGLFFDYMVSKNYQQRKAAGKPTDFWHSGGGFWLGGGRGGFGGDGGGFGGFGGGGSGGGGAGGSW
ncbi:TPM domain-containing protein [Candidatus Peregrinibacteria bacterium]|nr:TPM domain-containing protein [Candidatus Peregrinibacteria bacterium]